MDCLDEDTVLAFVRGDLPGARQKAAEDHLTTCDECRALVSAVARSSMAGRASGVERLEVASTELADSGKRGDGSSPVRRGDFLAGKYVVDTVLGVGGMGVVVSAHQKDLDRRVALKFLLPTACEVPGVVDRFLREGKAAARITSEHVARVIDTGKLDSGAPYLVMEHLVGADLAAVTKEQGRIPWPDAIEYVLQACEAIVEAHTLGIVHRDLKPANLFLTKRADSTPLVKVLDFGISKIEGGSRRDLTTASMLMGSPRYMSPEQMLSAKDVDGRTDVWALGVILYELVTGKPVWEADTVHGLSALIATAPAPPLRASAYGAPAGLEEVVRRCLEKSRDVRIASVPDLALALETLAPARAKSSVDRILKIAGRSRASVKPPAKERSGRAVPFIATGVGALLVLGIVLNVTASKKPSPGSVPAAPSVAVVTAESPPSASVPSSAASPVPAAPASGIAVTKPPVVKKPSSPASPAAAPAAASSSAPKPGAALSNRALDDRK